MRVFKSKWFSKFARKECITDAKICEAVRNAESGIIDADYGGGVIKQRIARLNAGKSSGYRTIILFRRGDRAFFVYGFGKNDRSSIDASEEQEFKEWAKLVLAASDEDLDDFIRHNAYVEIPYHA